MNDKLGCDYRPANTLLQRLPNPENINDILVICTGNICRSPMADGYLRMRLDQDGLADINVSSAGTLGFVGNHASREAIQAAKISGFSITNHKSSSITEDRTERADMVLVMSKDHATYFLSHFPHAMDKIFLLGEFSSIIPGSEIEDPIGLPLDYYLTTLDKIKNCVDNLVCWISNGAEAG